MVPVFASYVPVRNVQVPVAAGDADAAVGEPDGLAASDSGRVNCHPPVAGRVLQGEPLTDPGRLRGHGLVGRCSRPGSPTRPR